MQTYYYLATKVSYSIIKQLGIVPLIGGVSKKFDKNIPRISLYKNIKKNDLEEFRKEYEGLEICSLKIELPDEFEIFKEDDNKVSSLITIKPKYISYFRDE